MTTPSAAVGASAALIARQAIVNSEKSVIGYELFNRSRAPAEHTAASDVLLVFTAMTHAGTEDIMGDKLLFVNCTHESLAGGHLELLDPSKIVLEIQDLGHSASAEAHLRLPMLETLKQRGFKLSFGHFVLDSVYAGWLALANYIKLDLTVLPRDQWLVLIQYAQKNSTAQLIAAKMETVEQFELLQQMGIKLFQGFWFARPSVFEAKILAPRQTSLVELITLLRRQASTDEIEEVLKKDAGLAFNLMRLINSAGFGTAREITSFRQAVMIMGLKKLFRWAALLLTASKYGNTSASIGHTAVIRGRLMELLALEFMSEEEAEQAFVVGIFSLLDAMLSIPMQDALQLINIPTAVRDALLKHEGVFGELLQLAEACESSDDLAFDHSASVLQLTSQQINWAHLQALAWCDQITQ